MNNETLAKIEEQIGYFFYNKDLLQQAFVRRSYSEENGGGDNEVLEFIGDKVLDLFVVKYLTEKYGSWAKDAQGYDPNEDFNEFISVLREGKLTDIKKSLVRSETLAERIERMGFSDYLIMGKGDIQNNVSNQDAVKEDLFEAIVGAVALDAEWNLNTIQDVIDIMLSPDTYIHSNSKSYNELIQTWCQKKYGITPIYYFEKASQEVWYYVFDGVSESFDGHPKWKHTCLMKLGDFNTIFRAFGETKKQAREKACKLAYEYLINNDLYTSLIDEVGEPDIDRAINQLQELFQKGYIGEPWYDFAETYDDNGNPVWRCECHVSGLDTYRWGKYSSKKNGKKAVAYSMLCDILGLEEDDEA